MGRIPSDVITVYVHRRGGSTDAARAADWSVIRLALCQFPTVSRGSGPPQMKSAKRSQSLEGRFLDVSTYNKKRYDTPRHTQIGFAPAQERRRTLARRAFADQCEDCETKPIAGAELRRARVRRCGSRVRNEANRPARTDRPVNQSTNQPINRCSASVSVAGAGVQDVPFTDLESPHVG